ncbi:MAG: FAD-dependent oxidoreductase [Desulfobacterales bacterium]|nr:FAD-dependent oxidoreductase [Desulfobacterales bacterium]
MTQADGSTQTVQWDRLIIVEGAGPRPLPGIPFDGERVISSADALCLETVPESLVIAGGGVIGCEFATIFSALGSRVTLVEVMDRLLPLSLIDETCSKTLLREFQKQQIKCFPERAVESIQKTEPGANGTIGDSPFQQQSEPQPKTEASAERLLVCIGRTPVLSDMGLENLGVMVKACCYILSMGVENLQKVSELAILNANYLKENLKQTLHLPYDRLCMQECVFTNKNPADCHVKTLDIAKRLIDYGFHPPTIYFPLVLHGALMTEPTETENKETLDGYIAAVQAIDREARTEPELLRQAPTASRLRRLGRTTAARNPCLSG